MAIVYNGDQQRIISVSLPYVDALGNNGLISTDEACDLTFNSSFTAPSMSGQGANQVSTNFAQMICLWQRICLGPYSNSPTAPVIGTGAGVINW